MLRRPRVRGYRPRPACWAWISRPRSTRPERLCETASTMTEGDDQGAAAGSAIKREAGQLYDVARAVVGPVFKFLWRIDTHGLERVPVKGPAVMCPNHISFMDSLFLPAVLPQLSSYVGKA